MEGQHLGVTGLVEVGKAALECEWNDLAAAYARVKQGLELLPQWGKTDDLCLAYTTLARILLAQGNQAGAAEAVERADNLVQSGGVFCEARRTVDAAQVRIWLAQGDWLAVDRWLSALDRRFVSPGEYRFEDELAHITQARVFISRDKPGEAVRLLSCLEEPAQSGGRAGRLIEILMLKALAMQGMGDSAIANLALTKSLALAEAEGYLRIFLDEGQPMRMLLAQWLAHASAGPLRDYAARLLSQFEGEKHVVTAQEKASPAFDPSASSLRSGQALVEPLSPRELEVLHLMALAIELNLPLSLETFDEISRRTPFLCNIIPSGKHPLLGLEEAGGIPAVLNEIRDLLDLTALTINGKTLGENIAGAQSRNSDVIYPRQKPLRQEGGIAILRGTLAPGGAVIKQSAVSEKMMVHTGPARVFENEEPAREAVLANQIKPGLNTSTAVPNKMVRTRDTDMSLQVPERMFNSSERSTFAAVVH